MSKHPFAVGLLAALVGTSALLLLVWRSLLDQIGRMVLGAER